MENEKKKPKMTKLIDVSKIFSFKIKWSAHNLISIQFSFNRTAQSTDLEETLCVNLFSKKIH